MGLTAIALIHSPWGKRSGAHMNPAVSLTFLRLGKIHPWDALFYVMVQLIGGVILQRVTPMNPPHATVVRLVTRAIEQVFGAGYDVRAQLPIDLGLISEPEPDVAVVTGSPRDYLIDHPKTALLVIEVSESTIETDRREKASLYASGGIADYWVIDLTTSRVLVFRSPKPDPKSKFGQDYASVSAHGRDDKLAPLAAPNTRILVSDLLP